MKKHQDCELHCQAVLLDGWPECVVECERTKRRASVESGQNAAPERPTPRTAYFDALFETTPHEEGQWVPSESEEWLGTSMHPVDAHEEGGNND